MHKIVFNENCVDKRVLSVVKSADRTFIYR